MRYSKTDSERTATEERGLRRGIGLPGRVALTWAVGGGIALGGFVVALLTLTGRLSGSGLFLSSGALFVVGALVGLAHGGVLGYLGRSGEDGSREAARSVAKGMLYAIPALAVSAVVAGWIAMTVVGLYTGELAIMALVVAAWVAGAALVGVAAWQGYVALRNAYARWPARRVGTVLVAGTFAALLVTFLADRPEIWGFDLRVTETGAVLLAAALAIWVVGPLVTVALQILRGLPEPRPSAGFSGGWASSLLLGLFAGAVLALLALPFLGPATGAGAGAAGSVVVAVSRALVDEVVLRLVLMTGLVWALLRWHPVHREEAALAALAAVAVIQLVVYAPAVMGIGFASTGAMLGYVATRFVIPAAAFGALYWLRGLGTAVVADATAMTALAVLV